MLTLASSTTASHPLAAIDTLPWWAQLLIGIGMLFAATAMGWASEKYDARVLGAGAVLIGLAGLGVVYGALF